HVALSAAPRQAVSSRSHEGRQNGPAASFRTAETTAGNGSRPRDAPTGREEENTDDGTNVRRRTRNARMAAGSCGFGRAGRGRGGGVGAGRRDLDLLRRL